MKTDRNSGNSRVIIGLFLIFFGAMFLLNTLDIFDFNISEIVFSFPFILFVVGLIIVSNSRRFGFGLVLMLLGILFLIPKIFPEVHIDGRIIFPVLIICAGAFILLRRRPSHHSCSRMNSETLSNDEIDDIAIFGGGEKIVSTDNFKGGSITAIFGGSEIDLRDSKLAEGNNVLDILTIFGGTTLRVPDDWSIRIQVTPIFGGFGNKVRRDPMKAIDQTRMLTIKGVAIFGGGEIKS